MTTLTLHRGGPAAERRIMVARTVRSEFTKVRSVRSTYWTHTLMVLASLAWCVAYCLGTVHHWPAMSPQDRANFDPAQSSVLGVALLGQLVIVVFGALMLTSEYSTGSMRTSLTVMPRRTVLYGAKLAVFAAISLGVAVVTSLGAFFLGQALLGHRRHPVHLPEGGGEARREHLRQARPAPVRHRQPPGHRRHQVPGVLIRPRHVVPGGYARDAPAACDPTRDG
jgi:ABC-2 family transporter protein